MAKSDTPRCEAAVATGAQAHTWPTLVIPPRAASCKRPPFPLDAQVRPAARAVGRGQGPASVCGVCCCVSKQGRVVARRFGVERLG